MWDWGQVAGGKNGQKKQNETQEAQGRGGWVKSKCGIQSLRYCSLREFSRGVLQGEKGGCSL